MPSRPFAASLTHSPPASVANCALQVSHEQQARIARLEADLQASQVKARQASPLDLHPASDSGHPHVYDCPDRYAWLVALCIKVLLESGCNG